MLWQAHVVSRRSRRSLALVGTAFLVGLLCLAPVVDADRGSRNRAPSANYELRAFPLWKAVPVSDFALLDEGIRGNLRWAVYAYRRDRSAWAATHPCIVLATITREGGYGSVPSCGALSPISGATAPPVSVLIGETYSNRVGGRVVANTAFGMSFGRQVETVKVGVEPGQAVTLKTEYLSATQARKVRVPRFRYIAASIARDVCFEHVEGFNASNVLVLDADFNECPLYGS